MKVLQAVMDASAHAMFTLDAEGIITNINEQAKERFGLFSRSEHSHQAGKIVPGDIVIIADTKIGADDGKLSLADLEKIGIHDRKIKEGDMILAAGVFQSGQIKAQYKFLSEKESASLVMKTFFCGHRISVGIENKEAYVIVNGNRYSISYFLCIAQMVVLDGETGAVKFWEEKGYSARKEGVGNLLRGGFFSAKTPNSEIKVTGYHFKEFFEGKLFEEHISNMLQGFVEKYADMEYEINGFALVASLFPIRGEGKIEGVVVKFRHVEDLKRTIEERNEAIKAAEKSYRRAEENILIPVNAFSTLFGSSTAMLSVKRYAYRLSRMDCDILITGESGTGKSYLANAINLMQLRKGPFVVADCTSISSNLFESEMFGYASGAFTGASPKGKRGFFEEADGGTIFLDEIGEIPPPIQAKLLHVIQNKTIYRVGSTKPIKVDVRIIAATNRDIRKGIAEGWFRKDLYYRLSAFSLELPPLRECKEDIFFIVDNLMESIRKKYGMPEKYLSGEVFSKLLNYDWPGNIRELENVLERAVALSYSDIIYPEHIQIESEDERPENGSLKERLKIEERKILVETLQECKGIRKDAMEKLKISKSVFYEKLKEHRLS
ncbi:MAG: sigma 54-interacting transcriptional regulator [Peptostreptococcaceae bacterium]|nr:sigma 54-interacting transcriptional regulator [Peptostreptococcaceae bacterium]